jgi:hypothetical protein
MPFDILTNLLLRHLICEVANTIGNLLLGEGGFAHLVLLSLGHDTNLSSGPILWSSSNTNGWDDEPGDRDHRLDAYMSLREFERYVVDFVIEYNTTHRVTDEIFTADMIRDGVEPYPTELW